MIFITRNETTWPRKIETYGNLGERKIFKSKILEGGGCWELQSALSGEHGARERDERGTEGRGDRRTAGWNG